MNESFPLNTSELYGLQRRLLAWYDQHRRDLPWRADRDPYRVWVSEMMLQQTRVAAVLDYFARWMRKFPTVQKLAGGSEQSVLAAWSGLGYYHRARRVHQAARIIVRERGGRFPQSAEEWRTLPGVGRYTAAAIASIASGEAIAIVDGNVERVLTRMFGPVETKSAIWLRAELLLSRQRPGDFNQAMMELGAMLCTSRAPQCLVCPLLTWCKTRGAVDVKPRGVRKRSKVFYGLARRGASVLLVRRSAEASLMAGMWELPLVTNNMRNCARILATFRHSITNTDYAVSVTELSAKNLPGFGTSARWVTRNQWERLPLTGLARKILGRLVPESPSGARQSK